MPIIERYSAIKNGGIGQTSAAVRGERDGDLCVPNCLALQIESKGAVLRPQKSVDKTYAQVS